MNVALWQIGWAETLLILICVHVLLVYVCRGVLQRKWVVVLIFAVYVPSVCIMLLFSSRMLGKAAALVNVSIPVIAPLLTISSVRKHHVFYITLLFHAFAGFVVFTFISVAKFLGFWHIGIMVVDVFAYMLILALCLLIGKRKLLPNLYADFSVLDMRIKLLLLVSVWVGTAFANFFAALFGSVQRSSLSAATELLAYLLILLIFVLCPILIAGNVADSYNKRMLTVADKQVQAQAAHYALISRMNENLQEFRHNFNNIRTGVASLLAAGDVDGALLFLSEGAVPVQYEIALHETGNRIADALLYEKHAAAAGVGTALTFDGIIPSSGIAPADLCAMLGNALDNALEACSKLDAGAERTVSVSSVFANGFLFLKVQNPVAENVRIANDFVATTKPDAAAHGIGLGSIRNAARKYGGNVRLTCEHRIFTLELDLDLNVGA